MLTSLWIVWAVGSLLMVLGVSLVSANRPRHHHVHGMWIFGVGFVVAVLSMALVITSPVR